MAIIEKKGELRERRRQRIRKKIHGTAERPRMTVYKSNKHIYVQMVDDDKMLTIVFVSTLDADFKKQIKGNNVATAKKLGQKAAEAALGKSIKTVTFDRNGFAFHGKIKAVAEGAREKGLKF
jgi:large subunit ribosomal protein L18